jgi:hypothetical protein
LRSIIGKGHKDKIKLSFNPRYAAAKHNVSAFKDRNEKVKDEDGGQLAAYQNRLLTWEKDCSCQNVKWKNF